MFMEAHCPNAAIRNQRKAGMCRGLEGAQGKEPAPGRSRARATPRARARRTRPIRRGDRRRGYRGGGAVAVTCSEGRRTAVAVDAGGEVVGLGGAVIAVIGPRVVVAPPSVAVDARGEVVGLDAIAPGAVAVGAIRFGALLVVAVPVPVDARCRGCNPSSASDGCGARVRGLVMRFRHRICAERRRRAEMYPRIYGVRSRSRQGYTVAVAAACRQWRALPRRRPCGGGRSTR